MIPVCIKTFIIYQIISLWCHINSCDSCHFLQFSTTKVCDSWSSLQPAMVSNVSVFCSDSLSFSHGFPTFCAEILKCDMTGWSRRNLNDWMEEMKLPMLMPERLWRNLQMIAGTWNITAWLISTRGTWNTKGIDIFVGGGSSRCPDAEVRRRDQGDGNRSFCYVRDHYFMGNRCSRQSGVVWQTTPFYLRFTPVFGTAVFQLSFPVWSQSPKVLLSTFPDSKHSWQS